MTDGRTDEPWEGRLYLAAYNFGMECANLRNNNPYKLSALDEIISTLATELWDRGFSQSEIRNALHAGDTVLKTYCAGEERRGDRERKDNE